MLFNPSHIISLCRTQGLPVGDNNNHHYYSLGLNITVWVFQLPACLFLLFDLVVTLSRAEIASRHYNALLVLIFRMCTLVTIFFTLSTIVSDIIEIVKIVRRRMPLALYIEFASQKTLLYAIYLLSGLVFASPILTIVGGIMSITSFIQLLHGVRIGGKMREQGIAMTDEYELVPNPAGADRLEAGYNESGPPTYEAKQWMSYDDGAYADSPPSKGNRDYKPYARPI